MNIIEATKAANEKGWVAISREAYILSGLIVITSNNEGQLWLYAPVEHRNQLIPLWEPSQEDLLAKDWYPVGMTKNRLTELIKSKVLNIQSLNLTWE
ncbi:hypothetical protein [uncultured Dubosiella sp.]|uniref:Thoeris anti-defense Tad2 family protein n=1 Tax=uncultured Dubosiella sp. TaxID=1937011 RepID=UPI00259B5723|nr:hypothetical protein [uncultured Dubosiella sp.]